MSTTNEIFVLAGGHRVRLDLDGDTQLLPSFQANDRTKPDSIQSDYSPEFSVPSTAHNHRLLGHAVASQPLKGAAYKRVPAVLTSGGVETLPLAILLIKNYSEGRINLQLFGGNLRLVELLGDKKLSDLDFSRFDHYWTAENVLTGLPYEHWATEGWGYEVYDRGKPLDLQNLDPFTLYPSCSANLVWTQILTDAGFTADSLLDEPLWSQLNVPTPNAYKYSQDFRDARRLKSGFQHTGNWFRDDEFQELAPFNFIQKKPYGAGKVVDTSGGVNRYPVPTDGYYKLNVTMPVYFGCEASPAPGEVSMKLVLRVNGVPLLNADGSQVAQEERIGDYKNFTFTVSKRVPLKAGDVVDAQVQGDFWPTAGLGPVRPVWFIGLNSVTDDYTLLEPAASFTVELDEEFPPGGLVHLNEWLPDMKQLDFVKACMLILGLTIQTDAYLPHLHLAPGSKLLANVPRAKNWTAKRDAYARPGRLPERSLAFRFGDYGQTNKLLWTEDEHVTEGYGDGSIAIADEVLPKEYELATLPFAATENSPAAPGILQILNFETDDETAKPVVYQDIEAKPRLVLKPDEPAYSCLLITTPAVLDGDGNVTTPALLTGVYTTASYFDGDDLSLVLNNTVLTTYWADLQAMLDESRYLVENYRLTPQDIAELDFSVPIWDGILGDFFAVSQVGEYDARRPVEVTLCRLNATHLGPPMAPGGMKEWYAGEFYAGEWY